MDINRTLKARHLGTPRIRRRDGSPNVAGVCLHDTAGTGLHNDTLYLANPGDGRSVSVDFTVERDGTIYQLNPDLSQYFTFHAGRATYFRDKHGQAFRNRDVTRVLIGIELCQKANLSLSPLWPAEQVQAAAELCFFLAETFGFGKEQITTHQRLITDGSRSDPRKFPFATFWFYYDRVAGTVGVDTPAKIHRVSAGETLWAIAKKYNTTIERIKDLNDLNDPSNLIRPGQVLIINK